MAANKFSYYPNYDMAADGLIGINGDHPGALAIRGMRIFFFQAEDGIRDWSVTGVQTCALPILIAPTRAEAADKYERLQALLSPELAIKDLSSYFGLDLSAYPLDGPVPDPSPAIEQKGRVKMMVDLARRENLTIRQLYKRVYGQRGHRVVIGTPSDIADALEQWFTD